MKFSPNLTLLFTEVPFLERFSAARQAGFSTVEFQFPYDYTVEDVQNAVKDSGVQVVLFNLPAGDWVSGERGIAVQQEKQREFREGVERAMIYAEALQCQQLNCLAGKREEGTTEAGMLEVLRDNLSYAATRLHSIGASLVVEPCNTADIPSFFLNSIDKALAVIDQVNSQEQGQARPVGLQLDFYHVQRMQGELLRTYERCYSHVRHIQIADNPGRHEPGTGEIHYLNVLRSVAQSGYQGYIGLEYIPAISTDESLQSCYDLFKALE